MKTSWSKTKYILCINEREDCKVVKVDEFDFLVVTVQSNG